MTVYFIGAGPGASDLLTLRAVELLKSCKTCLYAGSLVQQEVLEYCPEEATIINTARRPLTEIIDLLIQAEARGEDVARLHSGDISVYSAVNEQIRHLIERGIDYQIVPGVPAFAAAAAALGQELTIPAVAQSLVLSRVEGRASRMPKGETLANLAASGTTLALHLAAAYPERIVEELIPHYGAEAPCAVVAYASRPEEVVVRCALQDLVTVLSSTGISTTALIFIGPGVDVEQAHLVGGPVSYLYSDERPRDAFGRTICSIADGKRQTQ